MFCAPSNHHTLSPIPAIYLIWMSYFNIDFLDAHFTVKLTLAISSISAPDFFFTNIYIFSNPKGRFGRRNVLGDFGQI